MTADAALVWADKVLNLRRTPSPDESMESYHAALMENCITALAAEVRALRVSLMDEKTGHELWRAEAEINRQAYLKAEAEVARLREAFARYARHDDDCDPWASGCRCGYAGAVHGRAGGRP